MATRGTGKLARREFLAGTAAAAAFTIVRPSAVRGSEANSTIELGLLGCGGRGTWITDFFERHGKYKFVTCADYYQDHADRVGEKCKIEPARRHTTLSAYKKMLEGKFDVVVIETPPYFHPEHAAAAVEAGKHVYCAKPIAIDAPGCKSIAESGRKATEKKLVFLVDFQTRANKYYRQAAKRVHAGELGRLVMVDATYPCGVIGLEPPKTPEDRLRRWYCTKALSGDFIVEQSIHAVDVATWFINADPIKATGAGGSKGLRKYGDIWDHFNVVYSFPKEVICSFYSVQNANGAPNEIRCRVYGQKGTVDTDYYSHVWMHFDNPKKNMEGKFNDMYDAGTATNIQEFYDALTAGDCSNPTVAPSVRSNLSAILGRDAAYRGGELSWEELMSANARLEPDLSGLKS